MNKFAISLLAATLLGSVSSALAADVNVNDVEPGTLETLLGSEADGIASLKVSGILDVRDLIVIADLPSLVDLDLSEAEITSFIPAKPLSLPEGTFPDNYLPAGLFFGKGLEKLTLPANLTKIGSHALAGNEFASLTLPETLATIGDYALYDCDALTEITMPASLMSLGDYCLASCGALAKVDMAAASFLCEVPRYAFRNDAALSEIMLPPGVKTLEHGAFAGCTALTTIEFPTALTDIGEQAFIWAGLTAAAIPPAVRTVGDFAFAMDDGLESVAFSSDSSLGDGVFYYTGRLSEVNAAGLTSLPDYTFTGDKALDFAGSDAFAGLKKVGDYALMDQQATKLILSPSLTYLGDGALEGMTSLREIDAEALGDNVPGLGANVFAGIDQKEVTLTVAEFTGDSWKNAEQWKEFRINDPSGIGDTVADASSATRAWFEGSQLQISAPDDMESVAVYLAGGAKVLQLRPYSTRAAIDTSDYADRMFIVEVVTASGRKVFKLMR